MFIRCSCVLQGIAANLDVRFCLLESGIPIFSTAVLFVFLAFHALTPTDVGCLLSTPSTAIARDQVLLLLLLYRGSEGLPFPAPLFGLDVAVFHSSNVQRSESVKPL